MPQINNQAQRFIQERESKVQWFIQQAKEAFESNNFDKTFEWLNKGITIAPLHPNLHFYLGITNQKINKLDKAIAHYTKAVAARPNFFQALENRANVKMAVEDYKGAIEDTNMCISIKPDAALPYYIRGIAYGKLQDMNACIADLDKFIEMRPTDIDAIVNRGIAYGVLKQYHKSIENYTRVIELDPKYKNGTIYYYRASMKYRAGDRYGCRQDLTIAKELGYPVTDKELPPQGAGRRGRRADASAATSAADGTPAPIKVRGKRGRPRKDPADIPPKIKVPKEPKPPKIRGKRGRPRKNAQPTQYGQPAPYTPVAQPVAQPVAHAPAPYTPVAHAPAPYTPVAHAPAPYTPAAPPAPLPPAPPVAAPPAQNSNFVMPNAINMFIDPSDVVIGVSVSDSSGKTAYPIIQTSPGQVSIFTEGLSAGMYRIHIQMLGGKSINTSFFVAG